MKIIHIKGRRLDKTISRRHIFGKCYDLSIAPICRYLPPLKGETPSFFLFPTERGLHILYIQSAVMPPHIPNGGHATIYSEGNFTAPISFSALIFINPS